MISVTQLAGVVRPNPYISQPSLKFGSGAIQATCISRASIYLQTFILYIEQLSVVTADQSLSLFGLANFDFSSKAMIIAHMNQMASADYG